MISMPSAPAPQPPSPPPNPPMFMPEQMNLAGRAQKANQGFAGTILGQTNPANTGQKTLLGQ